MNWKELISLNNMAVLGFLTYFLSTIRGWIFSLFRFVKRRFIMGVSVSGPYMEDKVKQWLVDNCYSESSKKLLLNNNMYLYNEFNKSLMWGNYLIRIRRFCWAYVYSFQIKDTFSGEGVKNMLGVDVYGVGRDKIIEEIKATFESRQTNDNMLRLVCKTNGMFHYSSKEPRSGKKIFGSFVNKVDDAVDKFIASKDIYDKFGRKYKTSILLYGPPGTGKTSIIKHLAERLNIQKIFFIDSLFTGSDSAAVISGMVNDDTIDHRDTNGKECPAICVIEDMDKSIFGVGDGESKGAKDMISKKGQTIDKLMQFLDSSVSPNNLILIITTNNLDLLPEPLVRSGRIDHKIYVGPLNKEEAQEMVNYYVPDGSYGVLENDEWNPADLENALFKHIMDKGE